MQKSKIRRTIWHLVCQLCNISNESSERHNVAEYLNQYLEMRLMEDGSAYMEMSYNSEEPDSAEILKVSWKLEGGKMREATSEYGDKCYGAVLVDRWNQFTINEDLGNLAEVMTAWQTT